VTGPNHEVIVVGGGLIGAVTALSLARGGRRVLLVDRTKPQLSRGGFGMDIRNIACSPGSQQLLESAGVWRALTPAPYRKMEVWEERGTSVLSFRAEEAGRQELGWILENSPTVMAVWEMLEQEPRADIVLGEVSGVRTMPEVVSLEIGSARHDARLLIGVDGAQSSVRSLVGVEVETLGTGQQALVTLVRTELEHEGSAYQRFLLDGPLALLPSRETNLSSVVWSQSPARAAERLDMSEAAFCSALGQAIEQRLGRITKTDRRLVFPLRQQVVADFNPHHRVLLIGDAARVLHPLAGLGANVGFEDVRDLLARVGDLPAGADPGAVGVWRGYARKRRVRARLMVGLMAGFKNVYGDGDPLLQWLRNAAVGWLDGARPVKQQLIREALGLGPLASGW